MNLLASLSILCLIITEYVVSSASLDDAAEKVHKGVDDVVKGAIKAGTEIIGKPVNISDVKFFLFTSKDGPEVNKKIDPFDPSKVAQTKGEIFFFLHGWSQNRTSCPWYKPLTELLLKKNPDAHIVQVDWGKTASDNYASAAISAESVGRIIANVIQRLVKEFHVALNKIVLIGHSMGGQIIGLTGKEYRKVTNEKLRRIIALDPAGPLFEVRPDSRRLNKDDADVVYVLHTDKNKFGFPTRCGTIDFYPNNGEDQPGCLKFNLTNLSFDSLDEPLWCSHRRAHYLFIDAIKQPDGFIATECKNHEDYKHHKCDGNQKVSMGDWQTNKTGLFFLKTSGEPPYIKHSASSDELSLEL